MLSPALFLCESIPPPNPAFQRWVMFSPAIHCRDYGIPPPLRGFNPRHRHRNSPPRRFNAGLCLARQFIAGITGFPPLRGFNPRYQHPNGAKYVKSEKISPARLVFERKWVTCGSKRVKRVSCKFAQRKRWRLLFHAKLHNTRDCVSCTIQTCTTLETASLALYKLA